jgi:type VI secretion system secreted protein VgrG
MNPSRSQREAAANPAGHASFASDAFARDTFEVLELHGSEALGEPFAFELTLLASRCDLDASAALREHACLRLHPQGSQAPVPYHGVLSRFEQLHSTDSHTLYRTTLVPRLWRLGLGRRCRSFTTEQPITDTLRKLLVDSALHDTTMRLRQPDAYRPRSFVCQYDESDLDFVHRWMQREGLFYLFEHDHDAERLLVIDHNALLPSPTTPVLWQPHQHMPTSHDRPCLHDWHALHQPLPQSLVLLQHNYRKARVQLHARAQVCPDGFGELALDHISFRDPDEGQRYARVHAQQLLCHARLFTARSTSCGLRCGQLIALQHHPRADFNRPYLITRVTHHAQRPTPSQPGADISYSCTLELIPHDTAFRTKPTTAWPRIPGTVGATVHARSPSPYAELDEHGRYSIRLHFDNPSPDNPQPCARVRMATPYAGSHHGMHMPLLAGTEVLVAFCNGMPDEPVITAAVPDSENPSPVNNLNPHLHHIRTAGGNHIQLNDRDNAQSIVLACPSHNTRIALGQLSADGRSQGYWISTQGYLRSLTVGSDTRVTGGAVNELTLGYAGAVAIGPSCDTDLAGRVDCLFDHGLHWSSGPAYSFSSMQWRQLSVKGSMTADDTVYVGGGLDEASALAMATLRNRVQRIVLINLATQAAVAAALALRTALQGAPSGAAPVREGNPWDLVFGGTQAGVSSASVLLACVAIRATVRKMHELGTNAHRSLLTLDGDAARLEHRGVGGSSSLHLDADGARLGASDPNGPGERAGSQWADDDSAGIRAGQARMLLQASQRRADLGVEQDCGIHLGPRVAALWTRDGRYWKFSSSQPSQLKADGMRLDVQRADLL